MILLPGGGKGAGKSTLSSGLSVWLENAFFLSLDMLRKKHIDGAGTNENNATAHERIMEEVREGLLSSRMVVF